MMQLDELNERVHVLHDSSVTEYILPEKQKETSDHVVVRLKNGPSLECGLLVRYFAPRAMS